MECPITLETFKIPFILDCGHTFEKDAIEKALNLKQQCPLCKKENVSAIGVNWQIVKALGLEVKMDVINKKRKSFDEMVAEKKRRIEKELDPTINGIDVIIDKILLKGEKLTLFKNSFEKIFTKHPELEYCFGYALKYLKKHYKERGFNVCDDNGYLEFNLNTV